MHGDELKPVCTMSRSQGNGAIAQGGRALRNKPVNNAGGIRKERQR